ncbi:MAG: MerR family transcriptional regulator [Candidatus Nitrohelix vancouverensis]|uniref:MerR family transcriptional regulator n=1 Tax=Candidatus Nitrohelix vancouverensis TaxID=2705534 RepID=A0A7T0G3K4_9BACT|nr:MAG: MerR family transcriptional regulator [Candidatus Nitrohelix vancouverensis]
MTNPIPDKLFYKIGEVAEYLGVEQHVLRYWEEEFQVLKPTKNKSGQRLYQRKDLEMVSEIKRLLYDEKYTIIGAKKKMKAARKTAVQLDFAFDREKFEEWRADMTSEIKNLIETIDSSSV